MSLYYQRKTYLIMNDCCSFDSKDCVEIEALLRQMDADVCLHGYWNMWGDELDCLFARI
jgi:hypothetical protein